MLSPGFVCLLAACLGLLGYLDLTCRLAMRCRNALRPQAERLLIEKRWLERAARSRAEFERRWQGELRTLYADSVPPRLRRLFSLQDFTWALDAECAAITNQEIASWTFLDRASHSSVGFERMVVRCLEQFGWHVSGSAGAHRSNALLVVRAGGRRIGVRLHYGPHEAECRSVPEAVAAADREGCEAACLVTNGRFLGATRVLAESAGVALLHCSQLDQIASLAALPREEPLRIAPRRLAA